MSRYENRLPPEGINVSETNVAGGFLFLLLSFVLTISGVVISLYIGTELFARHIPFAWEERFTPDIATPTDPQSKALQRLADKMAKQVDLPEGMRFVIIYVNDGEANAYASLAGQIHIHRGLIEQLHSENAVAMVLAHEMAHVVARDPIEAIGGRLVVSTSLTLIAGTLGIDGLQDLATSLSNLTLLNFSRSEERAADELGAWMISQHYGHLGGAREVFATLSAIEAKQRLSLPEFLSTHPETAARIEQFGMLSKNYGVPAEGELTPLPKALIIQPK